MDQDLLQRILGAGSVGEQENQIDQQLQDVLRRRQLRQPGQYKTGYGAALGGIADMISAYKSRSAEEDLRKQRAGLAGQTTQARSSLADAIMGAQQPVQAPPDMIAAPGMDQASQERDRQGELQRLGSVGELSGDPVMSRVGSSLLARLQQKPKLDLEQEQLRKAQDEREALASPEYGTAGRTLLQRFGLQVPQNTPNRVLNVLMPTAEKGYAAEQSAKARVTAAGMGGAGADSVEAIGDAIISGQQPPELKGLYRFAAPLKAYLAKQGFDLSKAQQEWTATQKHVATLNGQQQERLRQAVDFTSGSLDKLQGLYDDWKAVGTTTGLKAFNKLSLAASKQLPGDAGAAAQALEAQINDVVAELGNVYMGGNSPTDHALKLAQQNLSADWNEQTFKKAMDLVRTNLQLRKNALNGTRSAGVGSSRYDAPPPAQVQPAADADEKVPEYKRVDGKLVRVN
jgi:hypothetical protein